jgi:hypothetical protein
MPLHERLRAASERIAHAHQTGIRLTTQEEIGFAELMGDAAHALDPCGCQGKQLVGAHGSLMDRLSTASVRSSSEGAD